MDQMPDTYRIALCDRSILPLTLCALGDCVSRPEPGAERCVYVSISSAAIRVGNSPIRFASFESDLSWNHASAV